MIQFLLTNLPILISLVIGIALLVVEAFMPGFGVAGISGTILELVAIVMTYTKHGPMAALGMLLLCLSVLAIAVSMSLRSAARGRLSKSKMILRATESAEEGYNATEDMNVFLDRVGTAITPLRPTGMADFDGVRLNVLSEGDYIPDGTSVRITRVDGSKVIVKPIQA